MHHLLEDLRTLRKAKSLKGLPELAMEWVEWHRIILQMLGARQILSTRSLRTIRNSQLSKIPLEVSSRPLDHQVEELFLEEAARVEDELVDSQREDLQVGVEPSPKDSLIQWQTSQSRQAPAVKCLMLHHYPKWTKIKFRLISKAYQMR